ncbi:IS110 family transposase, partial [Akkermansiaceae bacterium]|nr:IS110 family transposase [Akkermansiaceae bacterium]
GSSKRRALLEAGFKDEQLKGIAVQKIRENGLIASIPGMGTISCQIMIAELPDISFFKSARELAAWAGVNALSLRQWHLREINNSHHQDRISKPSARTLHARDECESLQHPII